MHGTFNGIHLKRITSLTTLEGTGGIVRNSFRIRDGELPQLESALRLNVPALLILSSRTIEGRIVHYVADEHVGYEITIESKDSG